MCAISDSADRRPQPAVLQCPCLMILHHDDSPPYVRVWALGMPRQSYTLAVRPALICTRIFRLPPSTSRAVCGFVRSVRLTAAAPTSSDIIAYLSSNRNQWLTEARYRSSELVNFLTSRLVHVVCRAVVGMQSLHTARALRLT